MGALPRVLILGLALIPPALPAAAHACGYGGGGGFHSGSVEKVDVHRNPANRSPRMKLGEANPQTETADTQAGNPDTQQAAPAAAESRPVKMRTDSGRVFFEID